MCSVRLGQKYFRAGLDGGGDRKLVALTVIRYSSTETLILLKKVVVVGQNLNLQPSGYEYCAEIKLLQYSYGFEGSGACSR